MPLTIRLALTYLLVTLAGLLILGGGFVALADRYLADQRARELEAQAGIYAALLGELAATPAQLQTLAASNPVRELLPAGTVARIFSTAGALIAGDLALGPFPSRAALDLVRPPFPLPASQVAGRQYAARSIVGPAGPLGVVELSRDASADRQLLEDLGRLVLQAAFISGLVLASVSALVARSLARPIVALTRRAEALADRVGGVPSQQAPGRDEITGLEQSLDRLEEGLGAYVARIGELEQARARFYRNVSHELRTPLTAIGGALENLADTVPTELRSAVATLEGETGRLSRLVDELLRLPDNGLLSVGHRESVELSALAADVVVLLAGRARRAGVELAMLPGAPVTISGARDRLKQAMINLIDNALRVTPPGGAVRIGVERVGPVARIVVEDSGPGVAPELRELIWARGVRGGEPALAGSAGLGLAIVREIAEAHGGQARLDETYVTGARFVVELP